MAGLGHHRDASFLLREVLVEVGDVCRILFGKLRYEHWLDFLGHQVIVVDFFEPGMVYHFFPVTLGAQTLIEVFLQALIYEVFALI